MTRKKVYPSAGPAPFADGQTANYGLRLIEVGASDDTWGGKINDNSAAIDAQMKLNADAAAVAKATADGAAATAGAAQTTANNALPKAGGALTGPVTVQPPTADTNPATKKYVDDALGPLSGAKHKTVAAPSYTLTPADNGLALYCTAATAVSVIVDSAQNLPDGFAVLIQQQGTGQVTVTPAGAFIGAMHSDQATAAYKTARRAAMLTVVAMGNNNAYVTGNAVP